MLVREQSLFRGRGGPVQVGGGQWFLCREKGGAT